MPPNCYRGPPMTLANMHRSIEAVPRSLVLPLNDRRMIGRARLPERLHFSLRQFGTGCAGSRFMSDCGGPGRGREWTHTNFSSARMSITKALRVLHRVSTWYWRDFRNTRMASSNIGSGIRAIFAN